MIPPAMPLSDVKIRNLKPRDKAYKVSDFEGLFVLVDLSPKLPPALRGVLGVKSLTSSGHLIHNPSLQEFHRCQVAQC